MASRSPWSRYIESAVRVRDTPGTAESPGRQATESPASRRHRAAISVPAGLDERLRGKLRGRDRREAAAEAPRRRTDVRLGLPALLVWCAALAGAWLSPEALMILCGVLVCVGGLLFAAAARGRAAASADRGGGAAWPVRIFAGHRRPSVVPLVPRSFLLTTSIALVLCAAAAAHSAVASSQRNNGALADAIAAGSSAVAVLEVSGSPRALVPDGSSGLLGRWSVPAMTVEITTGGHVIRTRAELVAMGGDAWGSLVPGQVVRTTGKLKAADAGQPEAGMLAASSAPAALSAGPGWQEGAKDLRSRYVSASSFLSADARGLLPGMVTGDTSALDEGLNAAMKTVGMTHLTAVSGANCSLVLGALLLAARSLRLPRLPAAALALSGLALFVVMVGPDASVLRAALMGSIALASLAGGRSGRGLSFLCLAVIGLLLFDPGLGTSFGFLLSVLATLGIIVLGQRMVDWTPAVIPRWVAAAVAVPLSAQLLCGPVIVLLQPQFSTYSLLANVLASPLVAPVTLLGTAAVPLVVLAPWAATVLIAVAGTFGAGVAWTARFTAALPGASLAWPEGVFGLLTMVLLSALSVGVVWMVVRPRHVLQMVRVLHGRTEHLLELIESRGHRSRHYGVVKRLAAPSPRAGPAPHCHVTGCSPGRSGAACSPK
ncbi:ComEC/Rec2 family competence protein [Arthrobacter sp. CDRTa11]|uniref:ComEC/Rec2 family competence protein n=1 Tax=Arthrobacter sp. CDRTa11 TaxID=2651199 RepID=UPI002265CC4A|nr:ComEC/Rec2 family competence protein [Arthrobacter sp. CDRTa11]